MKKVPKGKDAPVRRPHPAEGKVNRRGNPTKSGKAFGNWMDRSRRSSTLPK